ncbi:MAG: polysulfide reductase NrfD [Chloroflexi bacterium]|nr:polysulfide reductase NrfD [Chloroflexota bacterium]
MALVDPFQEITNDMRATFRVQREWAQRRGLLLLLAYFFTGAGAGTWLFSWYFVFPSGLVLAFIIAAAGGVAHLLFLGRPQRFWRIVVRVQSSWVSRGLVGMGIFMAGALLYMAALWTQGEGTLLGQGALVVSILGAIWLLAYKGLVWAVCKAIPFWNTALLPILYITYGLRGGAAVLLVSLPFLGFGTALEPLELIKLWIAVSSAALILFYLAVMSSSEVTARMSVSQLMGGPVSLAFYLGVVLFGLVIPIGIGLLGNFFPLAVPLLVLVGLSSLVGDFYTTYCVARVGVYRPLAFPVF